MRISTRWIGGLVLLFSSAFVMPAQAQDAPTDAPVLVSPVDQDSILVTEPEVALEWQVAAGAATHEVQLFYSEPVEGQEPIPLKTKVLNDASQSIEVADLLTFVTDAGSDGDSTFHWRVRGRNASGEGPWSDVWQFTLVEMDAGPPEVENPGPQTIDELVELSVPIEATSPGGSTLGYALDQASLDAGMTIDPDTGVLTWTPSEEQGPGSYDVTVTVTDEDGQSSSQTFTITVNEVNLPPVLDPIADQAAEVDVELTIDANATDPDIPANNLTYSLDQASLDAGMVIDPATGVITWTPTADQEMMTFPVTVTVTDDGDPVASDSQTFTITVGDAGGPEIVDPGPQSIDELLELTVPIEATSPSGSALTYALDQASLDAGMVIDPATGVITWTPSEAQGPGSYDVTVTVTDEEDRSATQTFTITVNEVNLPPVLDPIADQAAEVDVELTVDANATDPDIPANNLTYSLDQASLDAGMVIDPATGVITWTPTADQEMMTFPVTVTVTDDGDPVASDSQTFTITVGDAGGPEIVDPGPQSIDELLELTVPIEATSPSGSALTYALDQASLDAGMVIDPATGVITWTPSEEQGPGSYDVTVTVTDEEDRSATQTFTITVNEVNLPPVLDPIADQNAAVDTEITVDANATDPDIPANNLTYSLDQASLDAGMTIDPATGVITWTPTADQEMMDFEVTVTVTDDGEPVASDTETFTISVGDAGGPLVVNPDPQEIDELVELTVQIEATSPSGSALTYALDQASLDAGMVIDPATGVITWTPAEVQGPGSYDVTVTVTDEENRTGMQTFTITVNEVNLPPVLDPIADLTVAGGDMVDITAVATDPDIPENALTYSLDQASLDAGMTIDPLTGAISWTPDASQPVGAYPVTVTVTDDGDPAASDTESFTITLDRTIPPVSLPETAPFCSAAADFDLTWAVDGPGAFDGFVLEIATDTDFNNVVTAIPTATTTAKAPLIDLDFGVTYYWRVITTLNGVESVPSIASPFSRWPAQIEVAHTLAYPQATESKHFRMISVPGQSGNIPVASTFSGTQAPDGPLRPGGDWDWSIWQDNSNNTDYPAYLDQMLGDNPFAPGVGYWAISTSAWVVPATTLDSAPLTNDRLFPIPLNEGNGDSDLRWTMIGNPFDFPVLWQDLIDENNLDQSAAIWDWTGEQYESVTILQPYKGYYYFNSPNDPSLLMPCILTPVDAAAERKDDTDTAALSIALSTDRAGTASVSKVWVSADEEASAEYDRFDQTIPPAHFESHRVTLVNREMDMDYPYFVEESRASFEDQIFKLEVKAEPGAPVYLQMRGLDALADREVYLFDDAAGRLYDLHEDPVVMLEPDAEISEVRLVVGDADFIASEEAELVPDEFKLMQSYPNPFAQQTTIGYTLPDPEFVTVEVYNMLGQRVRTLVHDEQAAGFHQVVWDGTADSGDTVASGMYIYVFKSQTHNATQRLVRVR